MSLTRSQRALSAVATTGVAVIVGAVGTAYACVPLKGDGQVNVTGDNTDGTITQNSGTFTGNVGAPTPLLYCESGTTEPGYDSSAEAQADGGDVITVTVNSSSDPTCAGQLATGTNYSVIINNPTTASASPFTLVTVGATNAWSIVKTTGCFTSATPNGNKTLTTSFSVNSLGAGTGTFTLPSMNRVDGTNAASSVCVGRKTVGAQTAQGIFVPMKIEATI